MRMTMKIKRHNLRNLTIDENPSLGKEAKHFARLLSFLPSLQTIQMDRCGWTLNGISELLADSWKLVRLKSISLKSNEALVGDKRQAVTQKLHQFQMEKCQNAELEIILESGRGRKPKDSIASSVSSVPVSRKGVDLS
jgi:hypothetical protein